jgi:hypothetical protein
VYGPFANFTCGALDIYIDLVLATIQMKDPDPHKMFGRARFALHGLRYARIRLIFSKIHLFIW